MTTRMFAVITGWCALMIVAVSLALLPEIFGAAQSTVHSCQGIALFILVFGAPLVVVVVVSTWIWEIARHALARRSVRQG